MTCAMTHEMTDLDTCLVMSPRGIIPAQLSVLLLVHEVHVSSAPKLVSYALRRHGGQMHMRELPPKENSIVFFVDVEIAWALFADSSRHSKQVAHNSFEREKRKTQREGCQHRLDRHQRHATLRADYTF